MYVYCLSTVCICNEQNDTDSECSDPTPKTGTDYDHGTKCAGLVGMSKNNQCGIGVAFESQIGGNNC